MTTRSRDSPTHTAAATSRHWSRVCPMWSTGCVERTTTTWPRPWRRCPPGRCWASDVSTGSTTPAPGSSNTTGSGGPRPCCTGCCRHSATPPPSKATNRKPTGTSPRRSTSRSPREPSRPTDSSGRGSCSVVVTTLARSPYCATTSTGSSKPTTWWPPPWSPSNSSPWRPRGDGCPRRRPCSVTWRPTPISVPSHLGPSSSRPPPESSATTRWPSPSHPGDASTIAARWTTCAASSTR
ncbi:hypothetical protein FB566_2786 [Stackebrandtia endophytica]|uniref:Uncharacterized protein n=1 Tax=Stackebrandtia endophytica TaxID=1496996 RepID=A0A543AXC8_9ACTN|nr:hypothetical protein FB566_2786 [Stackebrandtia endophytica]